MLMRYNGLGVGHVDDRVRALPIIKKTGDVQDPFVNAEDPQDSHVEEPVHPIPHDYVSSAEEDEEDEPDDYIGFDAEPQAFV